VRRRAVVFQYCCGSPCRCSTSVGAAAAWSFAWHCGGCLSASFLLCESRRKTPWDEPDTFDAGGHSYFQRHRDPSLLLPSAIIAQCLPAMWESSPDRIQLLPWLPLQTKPELSAVPARGWRE